MKRPWTVALIAALGAALLVPSAFALFAPPEMLEAAVALGDRRLWLLVGGVFAATALLTRLALSRRSAHEEDVVQSAPAQGGTHLR